MKRCPSSPPAELDVTDGTRPVGHLVPRAGAYEAFTADGRYLCKGSLSEARTALLRADRQQQDEAADRRAA